MQKRCRLSPGLTEKANSGKSEWTPQLRSKVSSELRMPLNAILGYSDLLLVSKKVLHSKKLQDAVCLLFAVRSGVLVRLPVLRRGPGPAVRVACRVSADTTSVTTDTMESSGHGT